MAVQKNTNDLLSQAATNLPNNTTQQISPQDIREMAENLAVSSFNKITDSALVGLKSYNTLVTYESGQACINGSDIYIANQITGPGAFNAAHWTLFKSGSGTQNKLAKFGANGAVTNSSITDNGTNYLFSLLNTNGFVKTNGGTGQLSVSSQVSATEGGTGKSSWVAGSIPYISATNTFGEVTAAGNDGKFLSLVAGVPTWATVSAPNLGTQDLTSTSDERIFNLKAGTSSAYKFRLVNSAGKTGLYYDGVGRVMFNTNTVPADIGGEPVNVVFGDATTGVTQNTYLVTTGSSQYTALRIFGGSSLLQYIDSRGGQYWRNQNNNANTDIEFRQYGNGARISITTGDINTWQSYLLMGAEGYNNVLFKAAGSSTAGRGGIMEIYNGVGNAVKTVLTGNRSQVEAVWFADGLVTGGTRGRTANGFFDNKSSGATSGTINALFSNGSDEAILTLKDDKTATFGGDVVFSQSTNSTATGANARIASHPTSTIVLTNVSLTSIGSIVAGLAGGHIVTLMNETGASITIVDAYGSAAAGEVIYTNTASNLTIRNNCGATFQYNATGACWTKI
jgi:hypothetical protein